MLRDFLYQLINPVKEIKIDKSIQMDEYDVHFLSIIKEQNHTKLWILCHGPFENTAPHTLPGVNPIMNPEAFTKKETLQFQFGMRSRNHLAFSKITIQNQIYQFNSSSGNHVMQLDFDAGSKIQFFTERNLIPDRFFDYEPSQLYFMQCTLAQDGKVPSIDPNKEMTISVETSQGYETYWIEQDVELSFDPSFEQQLTLTYGENGVCNGYVYPLSLYDIHSEMPKKYTADQLKHLSDDDLVELKREMKTHSLEICPEGMSLLMMNYELEEGYSLSVYSKQTLDMKQEKKTGNTTSALFVSVSPEDKIGKHGLLRRMSILHPVAMDYRDNTDVQILELTKTILGKLYSC